jgi:hypothetical protein
MEYMGLFVDLTSVYGQECADDPDGGWMNWLSGDQATDPLFFFISIWSSFLLSKTHELVILC